jgi:hypothetical protein
VELGSAQPQSGQRFVTAGIYVDGNADINYSVDINETTHVDAIPGDDLPDAADPLPFELTLEDSDEITATADETDSSNQTDVAVYVLVTDTAKAGGNG